MFGSIKALGYKGEVDFTQQLAVTADLYNNLFKMCGIKFKDINFIGTYEKKISDESRYDALWSVNGISSIIAEAQLGKVDLDHVKKVIRYTNITDANIGILICEEITDDVIEYFKNIEGNKIYYLVIVDRLKDEIIFNPVACNKDSKKIYQIPILLDNESMLGDGINKAFLPLSFPILNWIKSMGNTMPPSDVVKDLIQRIVLMRIQNRKKYADLPTPPELVEEMLNTIPEEIFKSETTTFLDPACGNGTFLLAIKARLEKYGHPESNILERLYGIDIIVENAIVTGLRVGSCRNIEAADTIDNIEDFNMKFDVVIGNPPFKHSSGTTYLYHKFYNKSIELSKGYVALVTPKEMLLKMADGKFDGTTITQLCPDYICFNKVEKYFSGVGTTFCWYLVNVNKQPNKAKIELPGGKIVRLNPVENKLADAMDKKRLNFLEKYGIGSRLILTGPATNKPIPESGDEVLSFTSLKGGKHDGQMTKKPDHNFTEDIYSSKIVFSRLSSGYAKELIKDPEGIMVNVTGQASWCLLCESADNVDIVVENANKLMTEFKEVWDTKEFNGYVWLEFFKRVSKKALLNVE